MPRAFLITHKRRFEEGLAVPIQDSSLSWVGEEIEGQAEVLKDCNSSTMLDSAMIVYGGSRSSSGSDSGDSGVGSPSRDSRKLPDSPTSDSALEETPTCVLDSPPFKKREFFNRGARLREAKGTSVSDGGESDSGCSSHNECRHDPSTEGEFSWDCPSGLSILLELMAQSPQRYMGRDTLADHSGVTDITRPPCNETANGVGKQYDKALEPVNKVTLMKRDTGVAKQVVREIQRNKISPSKPFSLPPAERVHGAEEQRCSGEAWTRSADINRELIHASPYILHDVRYPPELIQGANALYNLSGVTGRREAHFTQRKIDFENKSACNLQGAAAEDYSLERSESPFDQPLDYSQLSSRSKERREASDGSTASIKTEVRLKEYKEAREGNDTIKSHRGSEITLREASYHPQYEFILSPKMDRNGNLILGQVSSPSLSARAIQDITDFNSDALKAHVPMLKAGTARTAYSEGNRFQHPSAARHETFVSDGFRDDSTLKLTHHDEAPTACQDRSETSHDNNSCLNKPVGVYHPKLKYLLAATQVAKRKAEEEEEAAMYHQKNTHFMDKAESFCSLGQEENMFVSSDQSNPTKSSPGSQECSTLTEQKLYLHRNSNHFIPTQSDQYLVSKAMHKSPMFSTSQETLTTIDNAHLSGRSDAGVTSIGNALLHPHSNHQYQPHNVFQFDFPSSAVLSDFQISNIHKGSEQNLLSPFEPTLIVPPSSNPPPSSPHHFKPQQQLTNTIKHTSSSGNVFRCSPSLSTSSASSLEDSAQSFRSGLDPYECSECGKRYSTSSNLARHRQTHRSMCDKKARKCPHCDKVYVSMPAYSMHVRTHNQGCQCPHCGKKFSRPWLLQGHIRTHTGEKPFACSQCGKSFADKSNLRAHVQTHSTEKPYVCGRCGKAFALKSYLYKHEESSCMRGQRFNRR